MKGYPNNYYYEPYYKFLKDNKKVSEWAKRLHLACAGDWFVGKDYIAGFSSWADSYSKNKLYIWNKESPKYYDLKKHCEEYEFTNFTDKTLEQFLEDLRTSSSHEE